MPNHNYSNAQPNQGDDITISEDKVFRIPLKMIWIILFGWGGAVWSYFDLRSEMQDTKRLAISTESTLQADHKTIGEMHDSVMKLTEFAEQSKRMYDKYFYDYNDPDRKTR